MPIDTKYGIQKSNPTRGREKKEMDILSGFLNNPSIRLALVPAIPKPIGSKSDDSEKGCQGAVSRIPVRMHAVAFADC
jgi:hypothetical protein